MPPSCPPVLFQAVRQAAPSPAGPAIFRAAFIIRRYATHSSTPPPQPPTSASADRASTHRSARDLLSALEQQKARDSNAGPFPLGLTPGGTALGGGVGQMKPEKKWSELSAGGKVVRAGKQSSRFTLIAVGGALTALLAYALASELFSPNSPTVIFGEACDLVSSSPEVARYLREPYTFHGEPSHHRNRRNRRLAHQVVLDRQGNEHLLLRFFVDASPPPHAAPAVAEENWTETLWGYAHAGRLFIARLINPNIPADRWDPVEEKEEKEEKDAGRGGWFGLLKGLGRMGGGGPKAGEDGRTWEGGEVHADLVKDANGRFVWKHLYVDIPSSQHFNRKRVWVKS